MGKKKEYTKLEIELYEKLTDIFLYFKEFEKSFVEKLYSPKKISEDKLYKTFEDFSRLSKSIQITKIPKKFLILNKLSENKKNG